MQGTQIHHTSSHPPTSSSWWLRKPLWVVSHQEHHHTTGGDAPASVPRHLTLCDLIAVGVGGTVGSGIFVLLGYIVHHYAGPATTVSFLISGLAACCSGVCYAELAGRIPASGSTYAYAYVAMGEFPAVLAAACLTLEYMVSGAAVARSWGDKVVLWLVDEWGWPQVEPYLNPGYGVNPCAFVVSAAAVVLLADGIRESKVVTNIFTVLKVVLVLFMTVGGFCLWDSSNLTPFVPFGTAGVLRGATSSFFAYLGFDELCCLGGEALHPQRDLPRAVLWTLGIVTLLYVLAALALTGMQPHSDISDTSAFPEAFRYQGVNWAAQIAAAGEVLTLPVVVLISLMAQPRLQFALVQDGLLPSVFGRVTASGNLRSGAIISGVTMTLVATFVPFGYLDDLISSGILVAFSMTNGCVILMRREPPPHQPHLLRQLLIAYNGLSFLTSLLISSQIIETSFGKLLATASGLMTVSTALYLALKCHKSSTFEGTAVPSRDADAAPPDKSFRAPFVPFLPCLGIFVNWYLIAQLEALGIFLLLLYLGIAAGFYMCFGSKHSVGNSRGWRRGDYQGVSEADPDAHLMLRSLSLPRMGMDPSNPSGSQKPHDNHHSASM